MNVKVVNIVLALLSVAFLAILGSAGAEDCRNRTKTPEDGDTQSCDFYCGKQGARGHYFFVDGELCYTKAYGNGTCHGGYCILNDYSGLGAAKG